MPTSWKGDLEIGWRSPHLGWQTGPQNSKSSCTPIDCDLGPHFILCKPVPAIWIVYSEHTCFCRQPFILMSWQGGDHGRSHLQDARGNLAATSHLVLLQQGALQGDLCIEHSDSASLPHTHPRPPKHTDATNPFLSILPHRKSQARHLTVVNESPFYLKWLEDVAVGVPVPPCGSLHIGSIRR